jgi:ATP-dependent 26S proteasome regulatory subunit
MPAINPLDALRLAGVDLQNQTPDPRDLLRASELIERCGRERYSLVPDVLRGDRELREAQRLSATTSEAAERLNDMLHDMVDGAHEYWPLVTVRETADGPRAVCQVASKCQELAIHPDCPVEELKNLEFWEYVAVHENVVVGTWRDDPVLFARAHGEIASFKRYVDRDAHLVEVSREGHDEPIVELAPALWECPLTPHSRLILQRGNPHRAIALAAGEDASSKFEIPIENIDVRLEDLAGVEEIAVKLIEDIYLRMCRTDIRDQFGLQAMRGVLLYSYKPGMGKSKFVSATARWFYDERESTGIEVVLYEVKPNETKSVWHGGDAKTVRELWGQIRARQTQPRTRPLLQIVVFDEMDSLGRRGASNEIVTSSAQSDALEALLAEMDGLARGNPHLGPPSHVLCFGMTNRPDRVDDAAKRPGRFGDLVLAMPAVTLESAEDVMAIYARGDELPWYLGDEVRVGVELERIRTHILRPALASIFNAIVLRYKTDTQRSIEATAGEIMANVHFMDAMNAAKKRAAVRCWRNSGIEAVTYEDVADCLLDSALSVAQQMEADPHMLIRHLQVKLPVTRVDAVDKRELAEHRFLRVHSA